MKTDYLELLSLIIENQISLEGFSKLSGVDAAALEEELSRLVPVAYTMTSNPKPIYFFRSRDYPSLGHLFHCCKLFTFARGGSPYKDNGLSEYDVRTDSPYIQAAVYDSERNTFVGLRFLPLSEGIPFSMSAMSNLFAPSEEFTTRFLSIILNFAFS